MTFSPINFSSNLTKLLVYSLAVFSSSTLLAENPQNAESQLNTLPALNILPKGSVLEGCRFPRYDKGFHPSSLLTADLLVVKDDDEIEGTNVHITFYNKDASEQGHCIMKHAIYDQKNSTITANQATTFEGDSFIAHGTGIIFNLLTKKALLLGPSTSTIFKTPSNSSTSMLKRSCSSLILTTAFLSLTTNLFATPPAKLTSQELLELDSLVKSKASEIQFKQNEIKKTVAQNKELQTSSRASMVPFFKKIGKEKLLVTSAKQAASPTQIKQVKTQTPATIVKKGKEKRGSNSLYIKCDNGIYFDSDTGILVYLKNIHLTAPTFTLACNDELKIFLEKKETQKKLSPKEKKKTSPDSSFGQVKLIIATGHVKLISKDENGKIYIATAETASYKPQTGVMILRGGFPRIQYGKNQYLQSKAPGQYIKMLKNGKLITTGKWAMQIDTKQKP